jgi:hypothetical protein
LLEKIELLKGLQSVNSEYELSINWHTETVHVILELDIVEDDGADVVLVLIGEGL